MRTPARLLPVLALALTGSLACLAQPAAATPPRPTDLHVKGGDGWRPERSFALAWAAPPASDPPLVLARYRLRNSEGAAVKQGVDDVAHRNLVLLVPPAAGAYTAEVWFEDSAGAPGPAATAQLRFDDARPTAIAIGALPDWIGRTDVPLRVRLGHPLDPLPLAGVRGYAIAIDAAPKGSPCASADRCTDAETTLRGGVGDDTAALTELPEGSNYLHAVAVSGAGMKSSSATHTPLRVDTTDPVTRLHGAPPGWTNRAVSLSAGAVDVASGMTPLGDGPAPFTAIRIDGSAPAVGLGRTVATSVITEGAHRIEYYARDAAGNVNDGGEQNGIANRAPAAAWVRIDRTPPAAVFTNSQDPGDPDLVRVRITDALSGPDPSRGWIGVRPAGSGDRFQPLPAAAPAQGELRAHWRSDADPLGEYEFRAVAYDAAGNSAVATHRANGAAMVLANPLKATTTLRSSFRRGGLRRVVPYGRRVLLRGRLGTGLSAPLADAPVRVVERFAAGTRPAARTSTVRTGPDGTFAIRTGRGPSRTITVAYEGGPTLARSTGKTLDLRVRGRVRLRTSARVARVGGAPLVFRGRVVAPRQTIPPGSRSVQLQFRLAGLPWSEFRTVATDRRGHFRLAYRFSDDDSRGARFQFRAYVPAQENWPYEPAGSRPVLVLGR